MANKRKKQKRKLLFMLLLIAVISGIIIYNAAILGFETVYPKKYSAIIEQTSTELDVDKALLYALIKTESGFNPDAVSSADAKGLTQITPDTFTWLCTKTGESHEDKDLFTPEVSVYYGAYFIKLLTDEFGSTETALAAYHAGRGRVKEWLSDERYSSDGVTLTSIPYSDTALYVKKVTGAIEHYKNLYDM